MQSTTISHNLRLRVCSDMALMLVLVVCGVTVVHTAGVVTHAGDGHPVGVAEDRGHGVTWSAAASDALLNLLRM